MLTPIDRLPPLAPPARPLLSRSVAPSGPSDVFTPSAVSEAPAAPAQGPRVVRVGASGVQSVPVRPDGGYLVENETGTVVYYGEAAARYLTSTTKHELETEVVIPRDSAITVEVDGARLSMAEPGAVMIGAGSTARVDVEGNALVLRSERPPSWYQKVGPDGPHRDRFDEIARMNQRLFACKVDAKRFAPHQLDALLCGGVLKRSMDAAGHVEWADCKTPEDMSARIERCGLGAEDVRDLTEMWCSTVKRKLYALESGRVSRADLDAREVDALTRSGAAKENRFAPDVLFWADYSTEGQLRDRLADAGAADRADHVVSLWKESTRAGYDNTGLVWERGGVVAYAQREKLNLWNEQASEWITNSTAYAGQQNEPFAVGVSHVTAPQPAQQPVPFKSIRPAESLHRHPVNGDRKQTEGYLVVGGRGVLVTIEDGKPVHHVLNPGDMVVIEPGVDHCVMAADGAYEHLVFQVPSAFQYGLMFKESVPFERYGTTESAVLAEGLGRLAR